MKSKANRYAAFSFAVFVVQSADVVFVTEGAGVVVVIAVELDISLQCTIGSQTTTAV